jgi:hypothetical protein
MSKYDVKASFVAIIGDQKSGKSVFLNKLLDLPDDRGYNTDNSEGLLMWSVPYYLKKENRLIFFIECSEFSKNEGEDSLFALVFCMCSMIIYNVLGEPNEKVLTNLSLMGLLGTTVKDMKKTNPPKLVWTFRDVNEKTIKQTIDGNFSQTQMIDNKFMDFAKKNIDFKKMFVTVNDFFPEKACYYLPKAVEANATPNKEFIKSMCTLRNLIEDQIAGKIIYDTVLNARMMLTFINSALETIRDKNVIDLIYW